MRVEIRVMTRLSIVCRGPGGLVSAPDPHATPSRKSSFPLTYTLTHTHIHIVYLTSGCAESACERVV